MPVMDQETTEEDIAIRQLHEKVAVLNNTLLVLYKVIESLQNTYLIEITKIETEQNELQNELDTLLENREKRLETMAVDR